MTKFEEWFLVGVIKDEVKQGHNHDKRIESLYKLIRDACEKEFTEDNIPTLNSFLLECFEKTQK